MPRTLSFSLFLSSKKEDEVKGKKKKKKDVKLYTHTVHAIEGKLTLDFTVHEEVSSVLVYSRTPPFK
jgi:hypothetical protein